MTVDAFQNERAAGWYRWLTIARLPIQFIFLGWARKAAASAR